MNTTFPKSKDQMRSELKNNIDELDRRRSAIFEAAGVVAVEHAKKISEGLANYDGTVALAVVIIFAKALPELFSSEAYYLIEALDGAISDRVLEEMARKRRVN